MKTIRPTSASEQSAMLRQIKAGDTVWVRTSTGVTARFVVQQVERDTLIAPDGGRYASADIVDLKRRSFSAPRTAGLVAGIFGGLVIIIGAAAAAALGGLMGSAE